MLVRSEHQVLQEKLAVAGFNPVAADGYFGRATGPSRNFKIRGSLPSGVADEITVAKLSNSPSDVTEEGEEGEKNEKVENTPEESEAPVLSPEVAELIGVSKGTVGSAAKAVQQLLIDAGVSLRGGADGAFGRVSEAALKEYQKDHGLDQTGVADEATLLALTGPRRERLRSRKRRFSPRLPSSLVSAKELLVRQRKPSSNYSLMPECLRRRRWCFGRVKSALKEYSERSRSRSDRSRR